MKDKNVLYNICRQEISNISFNYKFKIIVLIDLLHMLVFYDFLRIFIGLNRCLY